MPDYKEMYFTLFRAMTKASGILQEAQQKTEQMYMESSEDNLISLLPKEAKEDADAPTGPHS